jgi:hypothetical protein
MGGRKGGVRRSHVVLKSCQLFVFVCSMSTFSSCAASCKKHAEDSPLQILTLQPSILFTTDYLGSWLRRISLQSCHAKWGVGVRAHMQQVFVKCMQLPEDCGHRARCVFVCDVCVWCVVCVCVEWRGSAGSGQEWRERVAHTPRTHSRKAHMPLSKEP